jgi:phage gp16-like protein
MFRAGWSTVVRHGALADGAKRRHGSKVHLAVNALGKLPALKETGHR